MADTDINGSLRSNRWYSYLIAVGVSTAIGAVALLQGADAGLTGVILGQIATLGLGAMGFGAWHDRGVRTATVAAAARVKEAALDTGATPAEAEAAKEAAK
jgi:hypothetical protein